MLTCSFYEATCESSVSDDVKESVVSDVIKQSYYHREDINTFFNNYLPVGNLKLQIVHADGKSETIDEFLVAIGILYYRVTGPYWQLIASRTKNLDFYKYAQNMLNALRE